MNVAWKLPPGDAELPCNKHSPFRLSNLPAPGVPIVPGLPGQNTQLSYFQGSTCPQQSRSPRTSAGCPMVQRSELKKGICARYQNRTALYINSSLEKLSDRKYIVPASAVRGLNAPFKVPQDRDGAAGQHWSAGIVYKVQRKEAVDEVTGTFIHADTWPRCAGNVLSALGGPDLLPSHGQPCTRCRMPHPTTCAD